jgi:hypothetical protein
VTGGEDRAHIGEREAPELHRPFERCYKRLSTVRVLESHDGGEFRAELGGPGRCCGL